MSTNARNCRGEDTASTCVRAFRAYVAAGVAMIGKLDDATKPISVQLFDSGAKQWLLPKASIDPKRLKADGYTVLSLGTARLPRTGMLVLGNKWGSSLDMRSLGRFYDPSYHEKRFEYFASVRLQDGMLYCDRVYLVDRGMP